MSLQVWLPLTKDLRNQGLSNVTVTNNGATFNSAGKLGGCYTFTNQTIVVTPSTDLKNSFSSAASLACWVKVSTSHAAYAQCMTFGTVSTAWAAIYFGIDIGSNGVPIGNVANGSNSTNCSFSTAIKDGKWHHLALTYESGTIKSYMDGVLKNIVSTSYTPAWANATVFSIGGNSSEVFKNGDAMNDVRLYNHCLSPMEIKELSKGLVLHYPLNRGGWGQENILLNTGFQSRYTQSTGWDTTKNGTQLANSWGGYNGGVSNPSTVYHAHLKEFNGEWVYEYIKTANESWLGISQGGLQSKLTAGKKYTFSWEQYSVSGSNYNHGGLYYYKTGASSANFHLGSFSGTGGVTGQWKKFSYTFTAPSDADYSKNMSWYIYGMDGGNGTLYMRHPKLEEGESATPWCPNSADALGTALNINGTTEYDCSGYGNNGTLWAYDAAGVITYTSDAPKYQISTFIDSDNNTTNTASGTRYIYGNCELTIPQYLTVAFWCKPIAGYGNNTTQGQFSLTNNAIGASAGQDYDTAPMNHRDGYIDMCTSSGVHKTVGITFTANEWHHYTIVYDGRYGRVYKDGIATGATLDMGSILSLKDMKGAVIGFSKAGGVWRSNKSYYSDFRIYATALSADDIKSLYQNSAYIDSSGNVYGAVHEEN